ncbi:MAG: diphosphate--fructose-6-phosphate 1-phosphotransferase [Candidatus Saganbacteria bacterium]|nr:diphosphate--fructose-6-phosphate 1-phosphotransferase [Candidatus Saganbacteria bacterium]
MNNIGELICEKLKKEKVERLEVLKDLSKIELSEGKKFDIHSKAEKDLSEIAHNPLLTFNTGGNIAKKALKVGVLFSGGPASGGHNVVVGLYDALKEIDPKSEIIGFMNGPDGLLKADGRILSNEDIDSVRNQGGFYLLGTSRTKFEKETSLNKCLETVNKFDLDGLLIIGGDDSNTNAAHLANFLKKSGAKTVVIGIPKTIDGDLAYLPYLQTSFGFYTAARIYSEMVGNICRDLPSSKKIWHFVKLMGRSASWITLETAFQTRPNIALIGEEIKEKKMTLVQVVDHVCEVIAGRHAAGKDYGIVLIPEGIVEFIPEVKRLISDINKAIVKIGNDEFINMHLLDRREKVMVELDQGNEKLFAGLPHAVQNGLLSGLDPHGNVQVSQIASDILLMDLCQEKLSKKGYEIGSKLHKFKMTTQTHFYGYDGRCGYPTWFDAAYTYNLGRAASILVASGKTGYMVSINGLEKDVEKWNALAIPLAGMMAAEERKGKEVIVISKYLVDLASPAFKEFAKERGKWAVEDAYLCPGPIQFWGPDELVKTRAVTMGLNSA